MVKLERTGYTESDLRSVYSNLNIHTDSMKIEG